MSNNYPLKIASSPLRSNRVSFDCINQASNERQKQLHLDYKLIIEGFVAYHTLGIQYTAGAADIQAVFRFALTEYACFDSLSVKKGEEMIVCDVKEKEEAKEEYKQAVEQGKGAALGGLSNGMMSVQIGNVKKEEVFTVYFNYIQLMESKDSSLKQLWMLLPIRGAQSVSMECQIRSQSQNQQILELKFANLKQKITQIKVSQFEIQVNPTELGKIEEITSDELSPAVYVRYSNAQLAVLSSFQNDSEISPYCCMIACPNPTLENSKQKTAMDSKDKLIPSEFIVLIDRSGSMNGRKIAMAVEALIFFLKSLPEGSIYNIVSFGSTYEFLHDQSLQVNDDNMQQSISKIERFDANFGGTDIIGALQHLFTEVQDQIGLRRKLFIITDGEFDNKKAVIDEIERNKHGIDLQILGIGDVDTQHIKKLSKITNGTFQLVKQPNEITAAVMLLMQQSFENQTQVGLQLDVSAPECLNFIVPNPQLIRYINPAEPLNFFLFFNRQFEETKEIKVSLSGSPKNIIKPNTWDINIANAVPQVRAPIHKLGLYQLIRNAILSKKRQSANPLDDLACAIQNAPNNCLELLKNEAIRYQILCEYTAFVGVSQLLPTAKSSEREKMLFSQQACHTSAVKFRSPNSVPINISHSYGNKKSAGCCDGGGSSCENSSSYKYQQSNQNFRLGSDYDLDDQTSRNINSLDNPQNIGKEDIYQYIIKSQRVNGSWKQDKSFLKLFKLELQEFIDSNPIESDVLNREDIWFTIFVVHWIQKACSHHLDIHHFILLKAYGFIDRLAKQYNITQPQNVLDNLMKKGDKNVQ